MLSKRWGELHTNQKSTTYNFLSLTLTIKQTIDKPINIWEQRKWMKNHLMRNKMMTKQLHKMITPILLQMRQTTSWIHTHTSHNTSQNHNAELHTISKACQFAFAIQFFLRCWFSFCNDFFLVWFSILRLICCFTSELNRFEPFFTFPILFSSSPLTKVCVYFVF